MFGLPFATLEDFIRWGGLLFLIIIVFAENGLFLGFFLPGDSLLVTAGLLAAGGYFNIWTLLIGLMLAAILGVQVGFYTGKFFGKKLFNRPDSRLFKKKYVTQAHEFYDKHGVMAIIMARFIPIVRTFAPIVAGAVDMDQRKFTLYNVVGGILWVGLLVGSAYFLFSLVPALKDYLELIILGIIVISIIPVAIEFWKRRKSHA